MRWRIAELNATYASLPKHFYEEISPTPVKNPQLVFLNEKLVKELKINLENLSQQNRAAIFSGNTLIEGSKPLALAYAGHQYGYFVPQLGDGRAILLGDIANHVGERFEIQLKGSGRTRFSRQGDGRSPLGPAMREYIVSEFMHTLNIPTTRSLAVVTTGETVRREATKPGGILTRVSKSHVRIGTFEYFAARNDTTALKTLADYMITHYYPAAKIAKNPYQALLEAIIDAQAHLIAQWLQIGFIHGVMNTDNTSIVGETLDYGPCAFMDAFDPHAVFSSIDRQGRYAYTNQAPIAQWNLSALAHCFLPLLAMNQQEATALTLEAVQAFLPAHKRYWLEGMCAKIGLQNCCAADLTLIESFLKLMHRQQADFTLSFRYLSQAISPAADSSRLKELFHNSPDLDLWLAQWQARLQTEPTSLSEIKKRMNLINPLFIPRNHLIEQAIEAAEHQNDFEKAQHLIAVLTHPYDEQPMNDLYKSPPTPEERVFHTFCGT